VAIILAALAMGPPAATAETQGVVVIVNDQPLTERDISERITLLTVLGDAGREKLTRKAALRSLIDEQVKIAEIARFRMQATDIEIKAQLSKMAKGMDTSIEGLIARLNKQGVSETAFKRYVSTLIGFNRVFGGKYRGQITVTDADVDAKMAEIKSKASSEMARIMNDPRMKAVTVYSLMEINLPAEGDDNMLLQARAADAQQVLKRFKGCGNLRAAADGVFNVKQGKKFDADATKIPKPLRAALEKAGVGRAVGPMRGKGGIQLLAFCGTRKLTPPKPDFKMPTREQVERGLRNEKYDGLEEKYLQTIRGNVYVEYRNSSYVQQ
jgi:peptidyl-prolyl cis-trans isomerase SurA